MGFGTHMAVQSKHGAQIQQLASIDSSCEYSTKCLSLQACLEVGVVRNFVLDGCPDLLSCDMSNACQQSYHDNCVLGGGAPETVATELCSKNATSEDVQTFLNSGNMSSRTSTIGYTFRPLADVLLWFGFLSNQSKMLAKAVEYRGCTKKGKTWYLKQMVTLLAPMGFMSKPDLAWLAQTSGMLAMPRAKASQHVMRP